MSGKTQNWAAAQKLPGGTKAVLAYLARRSNTKHQVWMSIAAMAFDTGYSSRTVKRALKTLEAMGLISRKAQWNPTNKGRGTDLITLNVTDVKVTKKPVSRCQSVTTPSRCQNVTPPVTQWPTNNPVEYSTYPIQEEALTSQGMVLGRGGIPAWDDEAPFGRFVQ